MESLGVRIKLRRKAMRLNHQQLSQLTGISAGHLSSIERGVSNPRKPTYRKLTEVLGEL